MGRKPYVTQRQSQTVANHKFQDKAASIDEQLDEAIKKIDWNRRKNAEKSLVEWTMTYAKGLTIDDDPPPLGKQVLYEMDKAITSHSNYAIALPRGAGKTAYAITTTIYALVTGKQKFVVIIANNARASNGILNDIWRVFQVPDSDFANDYPECVLPFTIANGSFKRRQLYKMRSTDIQKTADQLVLPTYSDPRFQRASGSLVVTRSITGGLRGLRRFTMRPSFAIIDDIQSTESAQNPAQVQKLVDTIQKDIIPLAGKERISLLQTFTPICQDDLVAKIKEDKSWTTSIYPAIVKYPDNMDLWDEYFKNYDDETTSNSSHEGSLKFYKDNQEKMECGSQVFNPSRFSERDGHISAIQKLLELKHQIGESAFQSEYQMKPTALSFALPITPSIVASRISTYGECELPETGVQCVIASSDLNISKYITTVILAFKNDGTAYVIWHKFRKCGISTNLPEADYQKRVYELLSAHGKELKQLADERGFKIDAWAIDANGSPFKAVTQFAKNAVQICGIPTAGFIGKASHQFNPHLRSRLKEAVNRTLLCGDDDERKKRGTGIKYTYHDSDFFHELVQKSFLADYGNLGSLSWYKDGNHSTWSVQVCGEKLMLKKQRPDGEVEYHWKQIGEDHDSLDAIGQCLAAYASFGYSNADTGRRAMNVARTKFKKKTLRIV